MSGDKTAADHVADIKAAFNTQLDQVKAIAERAIGKAEKGEKLGEGYKQEIDEQLVKMNGMSARLDEFAQKLDRVDLGGGEEHAKTIGAQLVESDAFKSFKDGGFSKGDRASVEVKATLTTLTTDAAGSVGAGAAPQRLPGMIGLPQRQMTIRDLISPGSMDSGAIEYIQETGFSNAAASKAEGAAAAESDIKTALVTTSAKTIAHKMKISREALEDVAQIQSTVDQRLIYGLAFAEESQALNGDGTGGDLDGLVANAAAYAAHASLTVATSIDQLRAAMLQAVLAEYPATGHVLNPIDWAVIEMLKDTTGQFIIGVPQGDTPASLWGLPVVQTQSMPVDKFLTGAFRLGAQLFDRRQAQVEVGYENDDFTKGLVTMLASERVALAVYRPEAFVYGDFGRVT